VPVTAVAVERRTTPHAYGESSDAIQLVTVEPQRQQRTPGTGTATACDTAMNVGLRTFLLTTTLFGAQALASLKRPA